jgi:capsular polysaccharide biosynthesis protein
VYTKFKNSAKIDFQRIINIFFHKLWNIIFYAMIGSLIAVLTNLYVVSPIYTSTSSIYIMTRQDESKTTYSDLQTGTQLTQDYMTLITSRKVMEKAIQNTGIDMSPGELESMITINNPDDTRILEISVSDFDPAMTKKLADAVVTASTEILVNVMEIDQVNVIDYANLPTKPTGQNLARSFLSGGILGFILSSAVIIIKQLLNENLKSSEDIENLLGITTLGVIPIGDEIINEKHGRKHRKRKVAFVN